MSRGILGQSDIERISKETPDLSALEDLVLRLSPDVLSINYHPGSPVSVVSAKNRRGRTVRLHPQETLLQQARALQHSEAFAEYRKRHQVSEHRLASLVQLGIRQSRYIGRVKTLFQLLMAATVANLTLVATKFGMMGKANQSCASFFALFYHGFMIAITIVALRLSLMNVPLPILPTGKLRLAEGGFRLDF